ncbi:MerR family transcriptional regulator [Phytohabitans sp. ZYX-F-186]|uniref:MerR family transcriptional regulator n=1 Tax=Phytohabitans maris TaxID=3071409 RepID=A0ABU0ZS66_9ACTN|nr:MerR family transcriptional regulator [Phytohabitans sp. ZYX-F-186]MDQ7909332.1 MerR family transcriptional regulator [Phytohabitans sp. ZYX-F-186]
MRIGELAAAAGVSNRTIDFYTTLGLITPAERSPGGYRLYDPATVDVIASIRRLEASGMALEDIGRELRNATTTGLPEALARLNQDLETLRTLAETADADAQPMAATLTIRAHNLITAAMELLIAMPDV